MDLDHRRLIRPGKKFRPNFLRTTSLLYKILPKKLGACKSTFFTSGGSRGGARGDGPPPPYFQTKLRPEGPKKFLGRPGPLPPPLNLSQSLDDCPPSPYLKVWIRHCTPFIHHIWKKQYYEALSLSYRPRTECNISQFCNTNCIHSIFRTIEARVGLVLAKPLKKIPKSFIQPADSHFCSTSCGSSV